MCTKKKTYVIPVIWEMMGEYEIEAGSLQEAIEIAEDLPLPEGTYLSDSYRLDVDGIKDNNPGEDFIP